MSSNEQFDHKVAERNTIIVAGILLSTLVSGVVLLFVYVV